MGDHDHPSCPFCPFSDSDASFVAQHIDFCHPENGAPQGSSQQASPQDFTRDSSQPATDDSTDQYVECPNGCGEGVTVAELSTHLDLHAVEGDALDESGSTRTPSNADLFSSDRDLSSDHEDTLEIPSSRNGGKRDANRDFARANSSKPGRARSPPRTVGPDGAKRLGVCFISQISLFHFG